MKLSESKDLVQGMSYLTYSDLFEEPGPPPAAFYGGFGLFTRDDIRKPAFFAYKYLHALLNKRFFWSLAICVGICIPAFAAPKTGDRAPAFSALAPLAGKEFNFSLGAALGKGLVVVYFYPSAYTGGCDLEAHTFATEKDQFTAAGATIIGVSEDSIARLNQFSADPAIARAVSP